MRSPWSRPPTHLKPPLRPSFPVRIVNISKFFIDRPIFAGVLSVSILLAGLISIFKLPFAEYPEIIPTSVIVRAQFPGANPKVIAETVASPLEEAINGVEDMLYMQSQANGDGNLVLTVTFKLGMNPDLAQQLVENRVSQALPRLPQDVQKLGVTTIKASPVMILTVHLFSPKNKYDTKYLRNYALINVKTPLERIQGVGYAQLMGAGDYSMRVWLDPGKVAQRGMTGTDVVEAIRKQNVQVAAGVIGTSPSAPTVPLQLSVNVQGRLRTESEFGSIVLKSSPSGGVTYLRDVARVELGASEYGLRSLIDDKQAVGIWVYQQPGTNSLQISDSVHKVMADLKADMPDGLEYVIDYDPTQFVRLSITSGVHTLIEAIALVVIVVIVFLQTWRASLIPLLAVPVSIIGTFSLLLAFGFSVNALSLFGLVLAIGIVLTVVAVFVPLAFMSGVTGQFYKQFAMTIAISTVISAFNSLTLSPALAALILRPAAAPRDRLTRVMDRLFGRLFRVFNEMFRRGSDSYSHSVGKIIGRKGLMLGLYVLLIGAAALIGIVVPRGFVPQLDKDYLISFAQLPTGATLDRSEEVLLQMVEIARKEPGVKATVGFPGLSINGLANSSSAGILFILLPPSADRQNKLLSADAIAASLRKKFAAIKSSYIAVFPPPPVLGLGTLGGFKMQLEDRGSLGYLALNDAVQACIKRAAPTPDLGPTFSSYQINEPQLNVDLDRLKAEQLGVSVDDVFNTMQVYLGSFYVNDFNRFGRVYQLRVQADAPFRANSADIGLLKTRNVNGDMVPLSSLVQVSPTFGPEMVVRYNGYTAADINSGPAPGYSQGQAQAAAARIAAEVLPKGIKFEWTDLTYQQQLAGNATLIVFPISILMVFLVLAALYESLTLPLAVILVVPLSVFSALFGVWITRGDNNIFTQIGLMVLVGLSAKNAILIVEFARELEMQGRTIVSAAIEASRLRLRPILMTSLAFIMGVIPLVLSSGAGAEMRNAIGIAVFFVMLGVTIFGLVLTPVFM